MAKMEELKQEIEAVKEMCKPLENAIKTELAKGIENIDTHEFGEAVDALKDFAEVIEKKSKSAYYCSIVKAMEDAEKEDEMMDKINEYLPSTESEKRYYGGRRYMRDYRDTYYPDMYYGGSRDIDRDMGRMYYTNTLSANGNSGNMNMGSGSLNNGNMRTYNESRYDRARRNYTETRDMHRDNSTESKEMKMRELEKYMQELSTDITELVGDMSQEEKNLLRNKINVLSTKI